MTEKIRTFYLEYRTVFEENFNLVLESFNVEAIHKMRTSTKRLRSLFILIEYLSEHKFKASKQLRKIRTLFKFAGRIREIQIEKQLVLDHQIALKEKYPEYLGYLNIREQREIKKFLDYLPRQAKKGGIINENKLNKTLDRLDGKDLMDQAVKFVLRKEKRIQKNISKPPSNKRIHDNRTHIKQVYYLFDILTSLTGKTVLLGLTYERLRETEQFFGEWHDLVNSPVYMNAFFKTKNFSGEMKYYLLKEEIAIKRKSMRQKIINTYHPGIIS